MSDLPPTDEGDDVTAGELALGVLAGDERAAALRRTLADPAFAAEVAAWDRRLAPMLATIPEATVPGAVWPRIAAAVAPRPAGVARAWRAGALASGALAATLAAVLVVRPDPAPAPGPAPTPVIVADSALLAQLAGEGGTLVTARFDAGSGRLAVRTAGLPDGARLPELWVIGADGTPRSLGLVKLEGTSRIRLTVEDARRLTDGVTIAVTLEPRDGAPHAAPSGDILATARLTLV